MRNWKLAKTKPLRGGLVQGVLQLDLGGVSDHSDFKAVLAQKGRSLTEQRH